MKKQLATYRAKRDFRKTGEPSGARIVLPAPRLRFVIQKHAARRLHYDLRLELDGVFKSWAVTRGPSLDPRNKRLAVEVEDHPLDYGDFEGTIPAGQYGGGTVQLWDRGYWSQEGETSPQQALAAGDLKFQLDGHRLHGSWVLVRMKHDRADGRRTNWLLIKHRDESAREGDRDAILSDDTSVASGRSMAEIARGTGQPPRPFMLSTASAADAVWQPKAAPALEKSGEKTAIADARTQSADAIKSAAHRVRKTFEFLPPQLCRLVDLPPSGSEWIHEIKFDGYRAQLHVSEGRALLLTRTGLDWSGKFPEIVEAAKALPDSIIDGEIVALDQKGVSTFDLLQTALSENSTKELTFFAFDLLFDRQRDLRGAALLARKQRLRELLDTVQTSRPHSPIQYVEHYAEDGKIVLEMACRMGLEGIVSKLGYASYKAGRNSGWTKSKCRPGQEVVIGGWSETPGRLRSLLVGIYHQGKLAYCGRVGTGFTHRVAADLLHQLKHLTIPKSPFDENNIPVRGATLHWVRPELVAEIEFAGFTAEGIVRQASFKGLRSDKPARDVVLEAPEPGDVVSKVSSDTLVATAMPETKPTRRTQPMTVMGVILTHPEKALWEHDGAGKPVTKLDLACYYEAVGEWILRHIRGRPCSIIRAPDGISGEHFFQRHTMPAASRMFSFRKVVGEKKLYLEINQLGAFAALAQIAAVELHPWNCEPEYPEIPGRFVFDLDPAPDLDFSVVVRAALELRDRLDRLGLVSFCKTTGGKGLHVVTPVTQDHKHPVGWPAAKAFARELCSQMAYDSPGKYLTSMSKEARAGKIFLDYLRNDRTATAIAPLSPRARPGAPVSMPLTWSQVKPQLSPLRFTLRTAPRFLRKSDPWHNYAEAARPLAPAITELARRTT